MLMSCKCTHLTCILEMFLVSTMTWPSPVNMKSAWEQLCLAQHPVVWGRHQGKTPQLSSPRVCEEIQTRSSAVDENPGTQGRLLLAVKTLCTYLRNSLCVLDRVTWDLIKECTMQKRKSAHYLEDLISQQWEYLSVNNSETPEMHVRL